MKGIIQVTNGQHYAMVNDHQDTYGDKWMHELRYPVGDCFIQVNHFKWDVSVLSRLKEVAFEKKDYTYHWEYRKMFDYILDNMGRININDSRFMIERCGNDYYDYPHWSEVRKQAIEYRT